MRVGRMRIRLVHVGAAIVIAAAMFATPALAGRWLSEARLGVALHSIDLNGGDPAAEDGADISVEALFVSPRPLRHILAPRPYVGASFNTAGDTDFFGFGLSWEQHFARRRFFVEGDFGLAWHNGEIDLPPEDDPLYDEIAANNILFGARTLFRLSLGIGARLAPRWRAQAFYEHLSNGRVFGDTDRNQGLDNIGLRLGYRFGAGD